jgi:tetratricopeptide (TPR) repeat protein
MDLLDFDAKELYFEEACPIQVSTLLQQAAHAYSEGLSELPLLQAYFYTPEDLNVLVGLYRFFYYQHRYHDALIVAERAMMISARRLQLNTWESLTPTQLENITNSPLLRFYLLALKGAAYLHLRLENLAQGKAILEKLIQLDPKDRLGASALLHVVNEATSQEEY